MAFQDFDLISNRREEERKRKKRKMLIFACISIIILLVVGASLGIFLIKNNNAESSNSKSSTSPSNSSPSSPKAEDAPAIHTVEKAVKTACSATDYTDTCEASLIKEVKSDSVNLAHDILKSSFTVISGAMDKAIKQASDIKFNTALKKAAFEDCLVLLNDAKEEINASVSSIEGKDVADLSSVKSEVDSRLSAVLTFQQNCIDGFPDEEERLPIEKFLVTAKHHGSNALALISQASTVLSKLKSSGSAQRKLLINGEDELPTWLEEESRRILKVDRKKTYAPNVTVAKDGSGDFSTINEALKKIPEKYTGRYVIYVKEGIYEESVNITKKMVNLTMFGDGSQKSIITGNKNYKDGITALKTATVAILGEGFLGQSIGFRNTAGPDKMSAVALRVQADRSVFVSCRMEGYQNVIFAQSHRQLYRSCYITGTVDIMLGDAAAIFQNCNIYIRKGVEKQHNVMAAQGRVDKRQSTGFVIQNCKILADKTLEGDKKKVNSYLGRPWKEYSRTVVMESEIGDLIHPEAWVDLSGEFGLKNLYFAEFNNKGDGADTSGRVKWAGYKRIEKGEASKFTVEPFLQGENWLKILGVPVRYGMFT